MAQQNKKMRWFLLVPLLYLFVFRIFPAGYTFVLSFSRYALSKKSMDWIGTKNYASLVSLPQFSSAFAQTLLQAIGPLVLGILLAFLSAAYLAKCKSRILRGVLLSLALLFSFVPEQFYALILVQLRAAFDPSLLQFFVIVFNALPIVGAAVLIGTAGAILAGPQARGSLRMGGAIFFSALLLSQTLTTNLQSYATFSDPTQTNLFAMGYQMAFSQMDISIGSALYTVLNLLQLFLALGGFLLVVLLLHKDEAPGGVPERQRCHPALLLVGIVLGVALMAGGALLVVSHQDLTAPSSSSLFTSYFTMVVGAFVFLLFAFPSALAASSFKRAIVPALFLLAAALSHSFTGEYLLTRAAKLSLSAFSAAIWTALSFAPLMGCAAYLLFAGRKRALWYALPLLGLALQSLLNQFFYAHLFVTSEGAFSLSYVSRQFFLTQGQRGILNNTALWALCLLSLGLWAISCGFLFAAPSPNPDVDTRPPARYAQSNMAPPVYDPPGNNPGKRSF